MRRKLLVPQLARGIKCGISDQWRYNGAFFILRIIWKSEKIKLKHIFFSWTGWYKPVWQNVNISDQWKQLRLSKLSSGQLWSHGLFEEVHQAAGWTVPNKPLIYFGMRLSSVYILKAKVWPVDTLIRSPVQHTSRWTFSVLYPMFHFNNFSLCPEYRVTFLPFQPFSLFRLTHHWPKISFVWGIIALLSQMSLSQIHRNFAPQKNPPPYLQTWQTFTEVMLELKRQFGPLLVEVTTLFWKSLIKHENQETVNGLN